MRALGGWAAIALVLALPFAHAAGTVSVEGVALLDDAVADLTPRAAVWNDTAELVSFELDTPLLTIERHTLTTAGFALVQVPTADRVETFQLRDVSLTAAPAGGHLVLSTGPEATARLLAPEGIALETRGTETLKDARPRSEEDRRLPTFEVTIEGPHLRVGSAGALTTTGPGELTVFGMDLDWEAAENESTEETGALPGDTPAQTTFRWVILKFDEGTLSVATAGSVWVAAHDAHVAWSGTTSLRVLEGELAGDGITRAPGDERASLEGAFQGDFAPAVHEGELVTSVTIAGAPGSESTWIQTAPVLGGPWLPWLIGAALLGGAGSIALARRPRETLNVEQYAQLAAREAEQGRHATALEWTRLALARAPGSARLLIDEGFHLSQLGEVDAALRSYDAASRATESGEPDYLAASLLYETGASAEEVEARLARALTRTPTLALEAEEMFPKLEARASFRAMVHRALRELS